MKTLLTTAILFFGILNGVQSQTMEKDFWLWKQGDTLIQRDGGVGKTRFEFVITPRPQTIRMKGNKVVAVYSKREWLQAQRVNQMRVMQRGDMMMRNRMEWMRERRKPILWNGKPAPRFDNKWIDIPNTDEREPEIVWENPLVSRGKIQIHNWVTYNLWWGNELGVALYIRLNKK